MDVSSHMPWSGLPGPIRTLADRAALGGVIGAAAGLALGLVTHSSRGLTAAVAAGGMCAGTAISALAPALDIRRSQRIIEHPKPSQAVSDAASGAELRVMTLNIRSLRGAVGLVEEQGVLNQIAQTINRMDPDVIVLQEVDSRTARSSGADQVTQISRRVKATDAQFVKSSSKAGGSYGQGIIVRHGLKIDGKAIAHTLPDATGGEEHRIATESRLLLPNGNHFTMIGTHVTTVRRSRAGQFAEVEAIAQHARVSRHEPIIVAGDFNGRTDSVAPVLTRNGMIDALTSAGVRSGSAERQSFITGSDIDHVFVTPDVTVHQAWISGVGMHGLVEPASDHRAVIADVTLPAR